MNIINIIIIVCNNYNIVSLNKYIICNFLNNKYYILRTKPPISLSFVKLALLPSEHRRDNALFGKLFHQSVLERKTAAR